MPAPRSAGSASANRDTSTPLGTISNAPPMREPANAAAASDTATRIEMRRAILRSTGAVTS